MFKDADLQKVLKTGSAKLYKIEKTFGLPGKQKLAGILADFLENCRHCS